LNIELRQLTRLSLQIAPYERIKRKCLPDVTNCHSFDSEGEMREPTLSKSVLGFGNPPAPAVCMKTMNAPNEQEIHHHGAGESPRGVTPMTRRMLIGAAAASAASVFTISAGAQTRKEQLAGRTGYNASDPGPENKALLGENPSSNRLPFTDRGNPGPLWYSFDIAPKRIQGGGWTHQVTQRELPSSKEIAGVNMRLTAGSFRELHWHTADEWAIMLTGKARVSVMQPDGKMAIDDVEAGDLWYFPAGFPHSIQGLVTSRSAAATSPNRHSFPNLATFTATRKA
jgi:quercetin dioxygenase-like cupin family protein